MLENVLLALVLGFSVVGGVAAFALAKWVLGKGTGTDAMRVISDAIKEGANAFLKRQYKTIIYLALMFSAVLFIGYGLIREHRDFDPVGSSMQLAFWITLSFVLGAICSLLAGYIGMWVSIRSNIRSAAGAMTSVNMALQVALRGGAVSGLMVVSMSLLGVGGLYWLVRAFTTIDPVKIPFLIVGYGFGASFVALFAQLGGGIYTKAADVGADLVGKVEAGIPEDDPRNPAVIADLVGDNVGDCAGRGADLFESTAAENIGAMILAGVMAERVPGVTPQWIVGVMMFPLLARAFGIIASIIGVLTVKMSEEEEPMSALNRGYFVTVAFTILGLFVACKWLFFHESAPNGWLHFFLAGVVGVLTSVAFIYITQYYTDYTHKPVLDIARASQTGPATNIIAGISVGLESTALSALSISVALLISYHLGETSGFKDAGIFGTAVATMGMLGSAAYVLAMDTFGPIADNAGGIIEMTEHHEDIRKRTDKLDAAGNTTKALTKGYAIGSAALAAFLLFSAYIDEVRHYGHDMPSIDLANPYVFVGGLLGATLVFLFTSLAIKAVGRAAYYVIQDVRDQFREKPGILAGTEKPDYGRCVDIVTKGALKEMVLPGLVAVFTPIIVGVVFKMFGFGPEAVASLLMVGTIAGILMATFLNNGGGAWDNAKKYIETGFYGGKGSDTHKAAVVGDTVGDPFKDTAGPSLHVLIKLLSTVTLVLAPLFI
ncbi:vacuolar-type H(+)-translocating pyrophosphatase [Candidatus Magnetobacterium bavaricum]|uniref:K(+)-insensitive pyrophosphate-energized proton pump n=1 Tax=Candidatus Magnetobacterium bavaricum TaxID=29290 RepID=A0A0F3GR56_9BACT|nr:vacuolar-type H(+)-translocating pyrophosphatase [Candidatus Magnetobacterium bavaricum]